MKTLERIVGRRSVLKAGAAAGLAWIAHPLFRGPARGQERVASIIAVPVGKAPTDPDDPQWSRTRAALISLDPQNIVVPRLEEAGAKRVDVRALYDADRLSVLLEWKDAHRDADLGTVLQYRDAVAIQFPEDPAAGPTSFMMGQSNRSVTIYHWKSDWQFGQLHDVDEAYPNMYSDWYQRSGVEPGQMAEATDYLTKGEPEYLTAAAAGNLLADPRAQAKIGPVQKMRATGFGTIEPHETQDAEGFGVWRNGQWRIVVSIPRMQPSFTFQEATIVPLAFAVWDGSRDERNGQKAISQWKDMRLALPLEAIAAVALPAGEVEGGSVLVPVFGGIGGAFAATIAALIGLRMRRSRSRSSE